MATFLGVPLSKEEEIIVTDIIVDMADGKKITESDVLHHILSMVKLKWFKNKEVKQIKYALEYLHEADLSDFGEGNIRNLESAMDKLGMQYVSQLD